MEFMWLFFSVKFYISGLIEYPSQCLYIYHLKTVCDLVADLKIIFCQNHFMYNWVLPFSSNRSICISSVCLILPQKSRLNAHCVCVFQP